MRIFVIETLFCGFKFFRGSIHFLGRSGSGLVIWIDAALIDNILPLGGPKFGNPLVPLVNGREKVFGQIALGLKSLPAEGAFDGPLALRPVRP